MIKTKINIAKEQQDLIYNSLRSNFNKIQFIKGTNYQETIPHFARVFIRRFIGLCNLKKRGLVNNFELTNPIDASISLEENIWPNNKKCAFISTHDIDSAYGQDKIENLFEIEKSLNIRSTNFWVTHLYKLNHNLLKWACNNGFEIGLHDYNHDGNLAMLNKDEISLRIDYCNDFIKEYFVNGIRSPGFLRSLDFYQTVKNSFDYDMSIVDYSFLFPFTGDGCRTSFPFFYKEILLIPTSLLRDGEAVALGLHPEEILNTWINKYNWLKSKKSLIVLLTHPDKGFSGNNKMIEIYKNFLEYVTNDDECWITTGKELSNYCKQNKDFFIRLT